MYHRILGLPTIPAARQKLDFKDDITGVRIIDYKKSFRNSQYQTKILIARLMHLRKAINSVHYGYFQKICSSSAMSLI